MFCPICDAKVIMGSIREFVGYSEDRCPHGCYIHHVSFGGSIEKFPKLNQEFNFRMLGQKAGKKLSKKYHEFVEANRIPFLKINIVGDGVFGTFLKELLSNHFTITEDADVVILAVPFSAYDELGAKYKYKHLVNVCSIQKESTEILLKHTDKVTSIHPLFGPRTPSDKRNALLTHAVKVSDDLWYYDDTEMRLIEGFTKVCNVIEGHSPEQHDILMAKTHLTAIIAAEQSKILIERAKDIPDEFIPHSFRLLRQFVQTLEDMPAGTLESIKSNPY